MRTFRCRLLAMRTSIAFPGAALVAVAGSLASGLPLAGGHPVTAPRRAALRAGPGTDWPTYHLNAARAGAVPGLHRAGRLFIHWSKRLDGAVYGQPLVLGDVVIAATERDTVYGLS